MSYKISHIQYYILYVYRFRERSLFSISSYSVWQENLYSLVHTGIFSYTVLYSLSFLVFERNLYSLSLAILFGKRNLYSLVIQIISYTVLCSLSIPVLREKSLFSISSYSVWQEKSLFSCSYKIILYTVLYSLSILGFDRNLYSLSLAILFGKRNLYSLVHTKYLVYSTIFFIYPGFLREISILFPWLFCLAREISTSPYFPHWCISRVSVRCLPIPY